MDGLLGMARQPLRELFADVRVQEPVDQSVPETVRCSVDS